MRQRTTIQWDELKDRPLIEHLNRFRARARGRRIKELALLGMLAERGGLRLSDKADEIKLDGAVASLFGATPPSPAPAESAPKPTPSPLAQRSDAHQQGLDALLGSLVDF